MKISLDLGDTVFNRSLPRLKFGCGEVMQLFSGCLGVLAGHVTQARDELFVICRIDPGQEARVCTSLIHAGLMPNLIDPRNVRFCFNRSDKGKIGSEMGVHVHIDDRVEVLNSMHNAGVKYKILFTGAHDDRKENGELAFKDGLFIVKDWQEVGKLLRSLAWYC